MARRFTIDEVREIVNKKGLGFELLSYKNSKEMHLIDNEGYKYCTSLTAFQNDTWDEMVPQDGRVLYILKTTSKFMRIIIILF